MLELVIVLYKMTYLESETIQSLQHLLTENNFLKITKIHIFDNSPNAFPAEGLDKRFEYYHSPENIGLAKAYNFILKKLQPETNWLLTLDQDTSLTAVYLQEVMAASQKKDDSVVLIAPLIFDQKQQISPVTAKSLRPLTEKLPRSNEIYQEGIMVINSGALVKRDFLTEIDGYNEAFPLDYLDHWLCWKVFDRNKKIAIIDAALQHQLSVLEKQYISLNRYQAILKVESEFYQNYQLELLGEYRKQLMLRMLKHLAKGKFSFSWVTLKEFLQTLGDDHGNKS